MSWKSPVVRWPFGLAVLLALSPGVTWAQGYGVDPVEQLQQAVNDRKPDLKRYVTRLATIGNLRRAMDIPDLVSPKTSDLQEKKRLVDVHQDIQNLLVDKIEVVVTKGSNESKRAVAVLIGELGRKYQIPRGTTKSAKETGYDKTRKFVRDRLANFLARLAEAPNAVVRQTALAAMGSVVTEPKLLIPVLRAKIKAGTLDDQRVAASALAETMAVRARVVTSARLAGPAEYAEMGKAIEEALPGARAGLRSTDREVRLASLRALEQIGVTLDGIIVVEFAPALTPEQRKAFEKLPSIKLDETMYLPILEALGKTINDPAFLASLRTTDAATQLLSRQMLEHVAGARRKFLSWREQQRKMAENLKPLAAQFPAPAADKKLTPTSLPQAGAQQAKPVDDPLRPGLVRSAHVVAETLEQSSIRVRLVALDYLEALADLDLGPKVARAVAARLQDNDLFVRWAAARTLGRMGRHRAIDLGNQASGNEVLEEQIKIAADGLAPLLTDRDPDVRQQAANDLNRLAVEVLNLEEKQQPAVLKSRASLIDHFQKKDVPYLLQGAQFGDRQPRVAILNTLATIGVSSGQVGQATEVLIRQLQNSEPRVRQQAAETLASFGPAATAALGPLERLVNDPDLDVRLAASDALLAITARKGKGR